jgi:hypothetical protein
LGTSLSSKSFNLQRARRSRMDPEIRTHVADVAYSSHFKA